MYTVTVRDHMMVAHSLKGESFGPAQALHGATYVVDATFEAERLTADGIVIDIDRATGDLHAVLADLTLHNLDDDPSLADLNTTTEVLAQVVADRLTRRLDGAGAAEGVTSITVTLHESHVAWASYRRAR